MLTTTPRYVPPAEDGSTIGSGPSGNRKKGQTASNKGAKKSQPSGPKVLG